MNFASLDEFACHSQNLTRAERFNVISKDIKVLARAKGMRFNCFWLKVLNISDSGILVVDESIHSVVTFRVGDELHVTLDMAGNLFRRPLHLTLEVTREDTYKDNLKSWGLRINDIEPRHMDAFKDGIVSLGEP